MRLLGPLFEGSSPPILTQHLQHLGRGNPTSLTFSSHFLGILLYFIHLLFQCNVPTLGHHYITEFYNDQSCQMEVIASTRAIEGYFGDRLASLILFHHYDPFHTAWLWFCCIPTISMILSYFGL
jgi:hypothetical protein